MLYLRSCESTQEQETIFLKNMIHYKVLFNYKQCTKDGIREAGIPNVPSFKFRILINNKEGY